MILLKCAICQNKEKLSIMYKENFDAEKISAETFSARRTPDRMHYRFVKCLNCGLIFSNPILEPQKIASLYSESNFHYDIEAPYLKKTYSDQLKTILKSKDVSKMKLLDIGCGDGFFLEGAKKLGIDDVNGIEPGKKTVAKAPKWLREKIKVNILKKGLFKQNTFDIICCFHTLDHIVKPTNFLQLVKSLLKKGGVAFFVVHDTDGLSVKIFGEKSPIFDIEHIYLFNPQTLRRIFLNNDFKVKKVYDLKNTYPLSYWCRMMPMPKFIKLPLLKVLKFTNLGLIPLSINAGNIAIVAERY